MNDSITFEVTDGIAVIRMDDGKANALTMAAVAALTDLLPRAQAEANFDRALRAVDQMLTRVGQDRLKNTPQMETLRAQLLEDALGFYQEFLRENRYDSALQVQTGRA